MKKFLIFAFVPVFVLLTGCSLKQKSDIDLDKITSFGSVVSTGIAENNGISDIQNVVETGNIIDTGDQNNDILDENLDKKDENSCTGNICSLDKIDTGSIDTGTVTAQVEEIKNILDKYADQITGDKLDDTDIEIMYKIIDVLTSKN